MRSISIGIHTARMGEYHAEVHLLRGMNGIDNMSLPELGVRVGSDNVTGAMDVIEDHVMGLQLRLDHSHFGVRHLPAEPRGGCGFAGCPASCTHGLEESVVIRPLLVSNV